MQEPAFKHKFPGRNSKYHAEDYPVRDFGLEDESEDDLKDNVLKKKLYYKNYG